MTLSSTSPMSIPNSDVQVDTAGSFTAATGTQVYEVDTTTFYPITPSYAGAAEYIPKELYSVIIAPGETATITVGGVSGVVLTTSLRFRIAVGRNN